MLETNPPRVEQEQQALGIVGDEEQGGIVAAATQEDNDDNGSGSSVFEEDHTLTENLDDERNLKQQDAKEDDVVAQGQTYAVWGMRILVALVLVGATVAVCVVVAARERDNEEEDFQAAYLDTAGQFINAFESRIRQRMGIVESFSMELTSQYTTRQKLEPNLTWPFFTPHHYYQRAEEVSRLAWLTGCYMAPRVEAEQRQDWIDFSQENSEWAADSLQYQGLEGKDARPRPVPPFLFVFDSGVVTPVNESLEEPSFPLWTQYPMARQHLVNFDARNGGEASVKQIESLYQTNKPSWPRAFDFSDEGDTEDNFLYNQIKSVVPSYAGDAITTVVFPVYEEFGNRTSDIKAIMLGSISWNSYFASILPPGSPEISVILENACDQTYSWTVRGNVATQVGKREDLHDTKYDYLERKSDVNRVLGVDEATFEVNRGNCAYKIRVYPTSSFEENYTTNSPRTYALSLAAVFVFTCVVFFLYDWLVQRRQKAVMKSALQSGKLVSSLFPKEIRERLYEEQEARVRKEREKSKRKSEWKSPGQEEAPEAHPSQAGAAAADHSSIARLYPETTILFADMAGFTKWSSTRTPEQVFFFLETLYGAFDILAKRYGVFKVETIGDCYVAVTGLPSPQKEHAVIMVKFARACMSKFRLIIADLAESLGEDTMALDLRVGLNSGPVTAGVLRGEKQRFQLFGDSVNVSSRMETTGIPGRIHCSEETAERLRESNKHHWLTPREDVVVAKGKGEMNTYWVDVAGKGNTNGSTASRKSNPISSGEDSTPSIEGSAPKDDKALTKIEEGDVEASTSALDETGIAEDSQVGDAAEESPRE